ncbi:MAG: hypothetical protein OQK82_02780 [Candidatus Pacearchaeota archaeon]|nr:hypothetical protein [Candidatus Pacearchaeota archaeon]
MRYLILLGLLSACGATVKQVQKVEGQATIIARVEISFPTCEGIEDEALLVECVKASKLAIEATGLDLSEEQLKILAELEKLAGDKEDETEDEETDDDEKEDGTGPNEST